MSKGWIKLHRSINDHWVFNSGEKSWGEAWIDLLMMASHSEHKVVFSNQTILCKKGEIITSILKLQSRWERGRKWVNNLLRSLEEDDMISQKRNKRFTSIQVNNYGKYQGFYNEEEPTEEPTEVHSEEHSRNQLRYTEGTTLNKGKELKELKKEKEKTLCRVANATQLEITFSNQELITAEPKLPAKRNKWADDVNEVFEYWKDVMDMPGSKLDAKRKRAIQGRLKDKYKVEDLKRAIDGCAKTPWNQGINPQNTRYDDIELICRNSSKLDTYIRNNTSPPRIGDSTSLLESAAEAKQTANEIRNLIRGKK